MQKPLETSESPGFLVFPSQVGAETPPSPSKGAAGHTYLDVGTHCLHLRAMGASGWGPHRMELVAWQPPQRRWCTKQTSSGTSCNGAVQSEFLEMRVWVLGFKDGNRIAFPGWALLMLRVNTWDVVCIARGWGLEKSCRARGTNSREGLDLCPTSDCGLVSDHSPLWPQRLTLWNAEQSRRPLRAIHSPTFCDSVHALGAEKASKMRLSNMRRLL